MKKNKKSIDRLFKYLLFIIPIGIIGNIGFGFISSGKNVLDILSNFSPYMLILAVFLSLVPWITNTIRLFLWSKFFDLNLSFIEVLRIVIGTELGSSISPTAIGGGYVKLGILIQKGVKPGKAASLMSLNTFEDGIFFVFALPTALFTSTILQFSTVRKLFYQINLSFIEFPLIFLTSVLLIGAIVFIIVKGKPVNFSESTFVQSVIIKFRRVYSDFISVYKVIARRGKSILLITLSFTAIQWICRYSVISALIACCNLPIHPVTFFFLQWIAFTLATFVPTPGGAVGAEAAFFFLHKTIIPFDILGIITVLWRFLTFYLLLGLGSLIFTYLNFKVQHVKNNSG